MALPRDPTTGPNRRWLWLAAITLSVVAAGCSKAEPEGQVIAIANGEEITVRELNEEARARGLPIVDNRALRDSVVRDLVDRKLLVQEALRRKLDRTPEHLLASRRLNEVLLAQALIADAQNEAENPSEREVAAFIQAHPRAFGQRVMISVDQIGFAPVGDAKLRRALEAAPTLDAVDTLLDRAGVARSRDIALWDSANLTDDVTDRLVALGANRTMILPQGDRMVAARVLSVAPRPVPEAQRPALARDWIVRQRATTAFQQLVQQARATAQIDYQREFDPRPRNQAPGAR